MKNFFVLPGSWGAGKINYPKGVLDLGKFVREYLQSTGVPSVPHCCTSVSAGSPVRFDSVGGHLQTTQDGITWVNITSL